ncbi:MAG: PAS domain-containing protein [Pseudodesulfovibrio sp.]|uniref:histidine kinase n=1 Tax=Pseudodesulfovibrio aespoeensis (strain ATCC 700646 / DSM 10631 / Aspo-2) TaxID=643562 RepID=E6VU12_PSEA9|nr:MULTISPECIES: ATP-binding protein [Pseudodesulfovibrio]MBU4377553.1 PAS domain-containing protein [Pseudomonadota bacterium]ADU62205.1 PAS sensor protein [Pseudodesulfovibrio aespoeensis Aspo-2]MBU4476106.1 PAS domain-containing protein [Pseudomonadota bacterium]MBU4515328.1 PAS domain-containing protein [Pseudomonadota bacterium]MBU4521233.1 PAS domain-containing protein [Pseudomonadota bacterium]
MRIFSRLKFHTKLNLGISAILIGMAVLLLPLVSNMTAKILLEENRKRGAALVESMSARAVDPLLARDFLRLKNMVDEQVAVGDVLYVFVQDKRGYVLAHTFERGFPVDLIRANVVPSGSTVHIQLLADGPGRIYDFASAVSIGDERLGTVRIGLSKTRINASVNHQISIMAGLFAGALLLATVMGTLFARRVAARIGQLREHAEAMLMGNLDTQSGPADGAHCWERQNCNLISCPAFGERRRRCWYIAGTMCPDCRDEKTKSVSRDSCSLCKVYLESAGDELQDLAETFDVMALSLKSHIDELRDADRSLRDQQRLMRTILDVTPDRVSLVDTRMRYQSANRSFTESVGLNLHELVGKTDFDIFDEPEAEARHMAAREILQSGERLDTQVVVTEDGSERWFHVVCIPVHDEDGRISGLLRTDRDITDIKGYEKQLIQAQKMESLGLMAGGVAHEINTPLGIILGYAQLLQEDVAPGTQIQQDLAVVEKQAKVCKKIVADLLGFSRQTHSAKREMCFNNSVMEAVTLVRHTFELDHVDIVTQLDDRFPIIYGDPEKLKQVWINLLTNSRDAMPDGGLIIIRTRLDTPRGVVQLWVADCGEGIKEDVLKKIFDPFYSTKPVGRGTGLGLSVSFGIIEDHDGEIHATSPVPAEFNFPQEALSRKTGPGTVFEVNLPLDHGVDEPVRAKDGAAESIKQDI